MGLHVLASGGNHLFSLAAYPGIWQSAGGSPVATAPAGRATPYAYFRGSAINLVSPVFATGYAGLIAGMAYYETALPTGGTQIIMAFLDNAGGQQCDLRMNTVGQLFFTRNGTLLGSPSTYAYTPNTWAYFEFKALFSLVNAGVCELRVNSVVQNTVSGVTNAAASTPLGGQVAYISANGTNAGNFFATDFYCLDTTSPSLTGYLGDITVAELFASASGVNSQFAQNVGPFTLTSVNNAGVYQGTITGGATNTYVGYYFFVSGFTNSANNGTFLCIASTATSITMQAVTVTETHAGTAQFTAIVHPGIHGGYVDDATSNVGTRPNGDVTYIFDGTVGHVSDFKHQALVLTGSVLAVNHLSYARKDDAGARAMAQVCLSGGGSEQSPDISLGNSYQYYQDFIEVDPNTGVAWTLSGLNNATFGVKVRS